MKIRRYQIDNMPGGLVFALLADVHGRCAGKDGEEILAAVRKLAPDVIFLSGDMIRCDVMPRLSVALAFLRDLRRIAPVFYVYGNHEQRFFAMRKDLGEAYENAARRIGITLLRNARAEITVKGERVIVTGLELPYRTYEKFRIPHFSADEMASACGKPGAGYNVLLVHNPALARTYFRWGANLILCGHYHGGLIRIGRQALLSPYGFPLPRYGYGMFKKKHTCMIVTGGAGDHKIPVRIGNPHEVVGIISKGF